MESGASNARTDMTDIAATPLAAASRPRESLVVSPVPVVAKRLPEVGYVDDARGAGEGVEARSVSVAKENLVMSPVPLPTTLARAHDTHHEAPTRAGDGDGSRHSAATGVPPEKKPGIAIPKIAIQSVDMNALPESEFAMMSITQRGARQPATVVDQPRASVGQSENKNNKNSKSNMVDDAPHAGVGVCAG